MEEITADNYQAIDIDSITLDRNRLGTLVFEKSSEYLKKLQSMYSELEELGYQTNLTPQEMGDIEGRRNTFIEYLNKLRTFDISQSEPRPTHDQLEVDIENFYNDVTRQLRPYLTSLRQEIILKSSDQKSLQKESKQVQLAKRKYDEITAQLEGLLKNLEEQQKKVETGHGKLATKTLAKHFDQEARYFETEASNWLKKRDLFFWSLASIVTANILAYIFLKTGFWFFNKINTDDFFNKQYLVIKVAVVALLSYGIVFASKNFRVNSNLAVINRHRRTVAQTLEDFLDTNPGPETQSQIIKDGVNAMFQHINNGYLSHREGTGDGGAASEIITNIIKTAGDRQP